MTHPNNVEFHISKDGIALIKSFEGWYPKAYKDPVGVWTIGWGTTGDEARPGRTITKEQGEEFLRKDLLDEEAAVKRLVKVALTQPMFDALVSITYNMGQGNLAKSTLLKMVNRENFVGAAAQFARHNTARDRDTGEVSVLAGLTRRRLAEAALFLADDVVAQEIHKDVEETHLDAPQDHDAGVSPTGVSKNPNPLEEVIKNSDTFKTYVLTFGGLVTAVTQLFEPLKNNPVAVGALTASVIGVLAAVFFKIRDTGEGR